MENMVSGVGARGGGGRGGGGREASAPGDHSLERRQTDRHSSEIRQPRISTTIEAPTKSRGTTGEVCDPGTR